MIVSVFETLQSDPKRLLPTDTFAKYEADSDGLRVIRVLSDIPKDEGGDPLRDWAISVLERPGKPPVLTKDAAAQLRLRALPEISSATLDTAMQLCSGSFPLSLYPGTSQTEFYVNYLECISTLLSSLTAQAH